MERLSNPRKLILECLYLYSNASLKEIYNFIKTNDKNKKASKETLRKNIDLLIKEKKIRVVYINSLLLYELNSLPVHNHMICMYCNKIFDLKRSIYRWKLDKDGNLLKSAQIVYKGICKNCLEKNKQKELTNKSK